MIIMIENNNSNNENNNTELISKWRIVVVCGKFWAITVICNFGGKVWWKYLKEKNLVNETK